MTTSPPPSPGPRAWGSTWLVAGVLLGVAAWAMPSAIQAGDAGEFATVMLRGGVPHPSGYPWMRILGWPARALEVLGVPPVRAAAWPCAALAIVGWSCVHRVALRFAPPAIASFAVLLLALSPTAVLHAFDIEVWGPLLAFAGGFLGLATGRPRSPLLLGAALGLVVSHHLTGVLLAPLAVAAAMPGARAFSAWLRAGLQGLAGVLLGLTPYLTLMLGSGDAWRWGDVQSLEGLLHHIGRADYGVFSLSLHTLPVPASALLERVVRTVGGALSAGLVSVTIPCALLLALVLGLALRLRPAAVPRRIVLGLWLAAVATLLLFPLAHNIDPRSPFGAWILERFDLLGLALLAPLLAGVLAPLHALAEDRVWRRRGLHVVGGLLLVRQLLTTHWRGVPFDDDGVERYAIDLLRTPTPGRRAFVFGTDDHRTFPVLFAQAVLGHGPEVVYVDASLLAHPWYRAQLRARVPELPDAEKPLQLIGALWSDPRFADSEVYLANIFSRPARSLALAPQGILWRVLRPDEQASPLDVLPAHRAALARYVRAPGTGAMPTDAVMYDAHPFAADLLAQYPERTAELARALRDTGHPHEADALLTEALLGSAAP